MAGRDGIDLSRLGGAFAKDLQAEGRSALDAIIEAARLRIRPIVMTSLAFILGVFPLAVATGAGSGAQHAIGITVLGGMLSATLLGVFFVPTFFVLVRRGRRTATVSDNP